MSAETLGAARRRVAARLMDAEIDAASLEARLMVAHVAGILPGQLVAEDRRALREDQARQLENMLVRRLVGEPLARIFGNWSFWGMDLDLSPATLVPRADTETVVEAVLAHVDRRAPLRMADIGTGSGALALALLKECPQAVMLAVDLTLDALHTARANAARHALGERFLAVCGDLTMALAGGFDVVVSNPPYIPLADIAGLAREVRDFDPHLALDGGTDGLTCYRRIIGAAAGFLKPCGLLAVEIGIGQGDDVAEIAAQAGLMTLERRRDLAGIERVLVLRTKNHDDK